MNNLFSSNIVSQIVEFCHCNSIHLDELASPPSAEWPLENILACNDLDDTRENLLACNDLDGTRDNPKEEKTYTLSSLFFLVKHMKKRHEPHAIGHMCIQPKKKMFSSSFVNNRKKHVWKICQTLYSMISSTWKRHNDATVRYIAWKYMEICSLNIFLARVETHFKYQYIQRYGKTLAELVVSTDTIS